MHRVHRFGRSLVRLAPAIALLSSAGLSRPASARSIHLVAVDVKPGVACDAVVNGTTKATLVSTSAGTVAHTFEAKSGDRIGFNRGTVTVDPPTPLEPSEPLVRKATLGPNTPNPFNPATRIPFTLDRRVRAVVHIYDVRGALVATLHDGDLDPGPHTLDWNGRDQNGRPVASGIYIYSLSAGGSTQSRKMTLLK